MQDKEFKTSSVNRVPNLTPQGLPHFRQNENNSRSSRTTTTIVNDGQMKSIVHES